MTYVGDVLDAATRTMSIRLELPNHDKKLKPEMYATVRVYSEPEHNVLIVPEAAVQRNRDRLFVFVKKDAQSFEAREVSGSVKQTEKSSRFSVDLLRAIRS